ncbi:hypothetical protein [Catellatospora methionotrophica]|uniref:hypothetical protein n=1 Tax=Catellatospora methionotrophica TaxID=121620 RepID=UPI0033FEA610
MLRLRDAAITMLCVAVLTPLLVLSAAATGFGPRHWSGVRLAGLQLPFLDAAPTSSGTRAQNLDTVTDELVAMRYRGWTAVYSVAGDRVQLETTRLDFSLFSTLGSRFGGDTVGVVYSPLTPPMAPDPPGDGPAAETTWQRTNPIGTWFTLLFGFPWQLGTVLLLTALGWTLVLRRRRATRELFNKPL